MNRRILYNRASADPDGKPWSERKRYVWWDADAGKWTGEDIPDFKADMAPDYEPPEGAHGPRRRCAATSRSSCRPTARRGCYAPAGLVDGPMPTHYEPHESPFGNPLYAGQQSNPARQQIRRRENPYNPTHGEPGVEVFPYVATTYRLTEHHTAGGMSRWLPYLAELQPEMFCEVSPALARRARPRARRLDDDRDRAHADRGARDGHRAHDAADRRGAPRRFTRSACPTTGARAGIVDRATRPTTCSASRSTPTSTSASTRRRPATCARARPRRAARALRELRRRATAASAGRRRGAPRADRASGFFTDTSVCIGCKACEVACKEWNDVPEDGLDFTGHSYDNTGGARAPTPGATSPSSSRTATARMRWLMSSDVCKHCTSAACLEVCPTGALFRTEFGTVVVQQDICNGCGYCVPACPYGVIDRREEDGRAHKCTLCYDRLKDDMTPACAKACPTESIQFGPLDEMRERAFERLEVLQVAGESSARLYGEDPGDGVGGAGLDLPAPRRARGLRPAARSGLDHARPGLDVARGGRRGRRAAGRDRRRRASAAGDERLLLRAADPQGAGVDVGDPRLLLLRRDGRAPPRPSHCSASCAATTRSRGARGWSRWPAWRRARRC